MIVRFRAEARAHAIAGREWWIANRSSAPEAFDDELAAAVLDLAQRPASIPVFMLRDGMAVRRVLLQRTRCHVYFAIDESAGGRTTARASSARVLRSRS